MGHLRDHEHLKLSAALEAGPGGDHVGRLPWVGLTGCAESQDGSPWYKPVAFWYRQAWTPSHMVAEELAS